MPATVYFSSMRADLRRNLFVKLDRMIEKLAMRETFNQSHIVALKLHFGEAGNAAFIRPVFIRHLAQAAKQTGAHVFTTDTNTLYGGSRQNAVGHLETAFHHGFTYETLGVPVMIADGLRSMAAVHTPVAGKHFTQVPIGEAVARADGLIVASHFKLHEATGFGGALKNLGMGCATREGKLAMHSSVAPVIDKKMCTGDRICVRACTFDAISIVDNKAVIDRDKCTGCAECLGVCPHGAIGVRWNSGLDELQEKMMEFAAGTLAGKKERSFHFNFVTNVSPACDCYAMNDAPIVADIGVFASRDPVAVDAACVDALNQAEGLKNSALREAFAPGTDKIKDIYPKINYRIQFDHAEKMGLGEQRYELISLG